MWDTAVSMPKFILNMGNLLKNITKSNSFAKHFEKIFCMYILLITFAFTNVGMCYVMIECMVCP